MKWSWRITRVAGTDIYIHASFVLAIFYIYYVFRPDSISSVLFALAWLVLVFGSVLLHELGHSIVSHRCGIPVRSIVLWPLGGFAMLSRQPDKPLHDILIAGAGPLVNLLLAGLAGLAALVFSVFNLLAFTRFDPLPIEGMIFINGLLWGIVALNVALAFFNLIPAYPLDGGRILLSGLSMLVGKEQAAPVTTVLSSVWGFGIIGLGALLGDFIMIIAGVAVLFFSSMLHPQATSIANLGLAYVFDRGQFYNQREEHDHAIAHYNRLLARKPDHALAYVNRGFAYSRKHEHDLARADFDCALERQPDLTIALVNRGLMHHRQGNSQAAEADYRRAIEQHPDDAVLSLACNNLAWLLLSQGDAEQALPLAEKAVELLSPAQPPGTYAAYYGTLASVYHALGRHDEAIASYDEALNHDPTDAGHYFRRGSAWYARGARARALEECNQTVQRSLGVALLRQHDLSEALTGRLAWAQTYYERMHQLCPDDARVFLGSGDAYRINGYHNEAIGSYSEALRRDPTLTDAYIGRGHAYTCQGDLVHALNDFNQAQACATQTQQQREVTALLHNFGTAPVPPVPIEMQTI